MPTKTEAIEALDRQLVDLEADKVVLNDMLADVDAAIADLDLAMTYVESIVVTPPPLFRDDFNQYVVETKYIRKDDPLYRGANNFDIYNDWRDGPPGPWNQYSVGAKLIEGGPKHAIIECTDQGPAGSTGPNTMRFVVDQRDIDAMEAAIAAQGSRANSGIKVKIMRDMRGGEPRFDFQDGEIVSMKWRAFYPAATNPWLATPEGRAGRSYRMPDIGAWNAVTHRNWNLRVSNTGRDNSVSLNRRGFDTVPAIDITSSGWLVKKAAWVPVDRWFTMELRFKVGTMSKEPTSWYLPIDKASGEPWFEMFLDDALVMAATCTTRGSYETGVNSMGFGLNNGSVASEVFYDWIEIHKG
jgi:hypothetical protein